MTHGITIRALRTADLTAADEIVTAAYATPGSRRTELARYLRLRPDGWLLALLDGEPAGVVGATHYGPFAYVGMLGVHPRAQRRGVALALMRRLLVDLEAAGCPTILLDASAAGEPLYARLGFSEDARTLLYQHTAPLPSLDDAGVAPLNCDLLNAVARFDRPVFGAGRQDVLASYLADARGRAFVASGATGAISGYLIAQRQRIGPWAAADPTTAGRLLRAALRLDYDGPPIVLTPSANHAAVRLLEGYGFVLQRSLSHMRLGGAAPTRERTSLFGQASFAIG